MLTAQIAKYQVRGRGLRVINKKNLGDVTGRKGFFRFRRVKTVSARLMEEPFVVVRPEGNKFCERGYLIVNEDGSLDAVPFDEFNDEFHRSHNY